LGEFTVENNLELGRGELPVEDFISRRKENLKRETGLRVHRESDCRNRNLRTTNTAK
jgi:hypothetical protein